MQSASSANDTLRMISIVQIILTLVGLLLLFTTPLATYYTGYNYAIWYDSGAVTWSLTVISVGLLAFIAYCGFKRGWAPSAEIAAKYAKLTITLGLVLIMFSIVVGVISYVLALADGAVDYYVGTVPIAFLVGGVLFMLIGFVRPSAT